MFIEIIVKRMAVCHPFFISSFLFFILLTSPTLGQFNFSSQEKQLYLEILNLDLEVKNQAETKNISNLYLTNYKYSLSLALSEDQSQYSTYQTLIEGNINKIENSDYNDTLKQFYLAESYLFLSFIQVLFDDKFDAYWNFRKAYKLNRSNIKNHPNFYPNYKTAGLLNITIASFPSQYDWITNLLGFEGDFDTAHNYFLLSASKSELLAEESYLFDALSQTLLAKNNVKGLESLKKASRINDSINAYHLIAGVILNKSKTPALAKEQLNKIPLYKRNSTLPFTYFLLGNIDLVNGSYQSSISNFKNFLSTYKGKNHIKSTHYKLFCAYYLSHQDDLALKEKTLILTTGQNMIETDQYAEREAKETSLPHRGLLTARINFDAGNFEQSLNTLLAIDKTTLTNLQQSEYYYRLGRVRQKMNKYISAISNYKKALLIEQQSSTNYFIPNACLQTGLIYSSLENKDSAMVYLKKTLTFKGYPYEKSIARKAKHAIKEID